MAQNIFRLVLTDEAQNFIESLPEAVSYKIYYNIKRVAGGERNKELFKKLENSEIWEFRTLYNKNCLSFICFLGQRKRNIGNCHSRNHQENPKDTKQGNCENRSY